MKRTIYYPEYTQNNLEKYRRLLPPKRHISQPLVYMEMSYDGGAFTTELYLDLHDERQLLIPYESRTEQSVALNSIGLHSHDYFEFFIVASGTLKIRMGGSLKEFHTGEICILNKNALHVELFESNAALLYLGISDSVFPYLSEQTGGSSFVPHSIISDFFARNLDETQSQKSEYLFFVPRGSTSVLPLVQDIAARMRTQRISSKAYILADMLEIFELLCDFECYEGRCTTLDDYPFVSISEIIKRMIDEKHGFISVQEISSHLNYNTTYVSRILKSIPDSPQSNTVSSAR